MPPWISDFEDPLEDDPLDLLFLGRATPAAEGALEYDDDSPRPSPFIQEASPLTSEQPSFSSTTSLPESPSLSDTQYSRVLEAQLEKQRIEVRIPKSTLVTPRGRYEGWVPPAPRAKEHVAVRSLLDRLAESLDLESEDFIEFDLDRFSIYVESAHYPCEMRPLQHLCTRKDEFFFDGVLSLGELKFWVERVPFNELPMGNYGIDHASVEDQLWIRSRTHVKNDRQIFYKLKKPSVEYERFHVAFLWIANLAKHVVDYCEYLTTEKSRAVATRHFQDMFFQWLRSKYKSSPEFRNWHQMHGSDDFRGALSANIDFIWKEACGVLGYKKAKSLQVFRELKDLTQYQPFIAGVLGDKRNPVQPSTVVTPYIHKCFSHTEFGGLLEPLGVSRKGEREYAAENAAEFRTAEEVVQEEVAAAQKRPKHHLVDNIKVGDTISTPPDGAGSGTKWKNEVAKGSTDERRWFGLVQKIHVSPKIGARSFDVTWLYRPVDTPCCKMVYPWSKELFLSDHCTCEDGRDSRVDEDEVLAIHDVDWFGSPETTAAEFFVRQTYQVEQRRWVTLERHHMTCTHGPEHIGYKPGDTVLATLSVQQDRSHVYEVVKVFKQGKNKFARLRRLLRRCEVDRSKGHVRPNELVYTEQTDVVKTQRVLGRCIVRFFDAHEPIPPPYDRNGTANIFFITHRLLEDGACVPIPDYNRPSTMRQGFNPEQRVEKLRGLDLFCGSGNFGRGLEEGGVVDMCWANDIWTEAIHTYMVNASHHTKPFLGSVDDLLRCAIEGDHSLGVPTRGEVDFISGGSPCQGFSLITADKTHDRQKKNRSLVASFASFVDFYRPKFGILENVLNIVQTGANREEDAFSQLICAIVGMGYQVQLTLGDAWTYGAPQSRSRAFLYFAAPGHRLPEPPRPSHSHFDGVKGRGLGKMTNGESFVSRSFDPTPFKYVSASEATADLPDIQDAKPDYCVGYPDHRLSMGVTSKSRFCYNQIPIQPYGMNFVKTWNDGKGIMTPAERELFPEKGLRVGKLSKGWGRIDPTRIFPTITTCITPTDARTGQLLHWRESRPITIMEARRAQGFLDHEVLVGNVSSQYELVGNSVARPMALALGLQFREAWLGSLYDDAIPVVAAIDMHDSVDASLGEFPLKAPDPKDEEAGQDEQDLEMNWEHDEHSSSFSPAIRGLTDLEDIVSSGPLLSKATPPTNLSESEVKNQPSSSHKRVLSESFSVDTTASKVRKVEVESVAVQMHPPQPNGNENGGVSSSFSEVVLEREHIDLTVTAGQTGLDLDNASAVVANGTRAEVIDLTGSVPEQRGAMEA